MQHWTARFRHPHDWPWGHSFAWRSRPCTWGPMIFWRNRFLPNAWSKSVRGPLEKRQLVLENRRLHASSARSRILAWWAGAWHGRGTAAHRRTGTHPGRSAGARRRNWRSPEVVACAIHEASGAAARSSPSIAAPRREHFRARCLATRLAFHRRHGGAGKLEYARRHGVRRISRPWHSRSNCCAVPGKTIERLGGNESTRASTAASSPPPRPTCQALSERASSVMTCCYRLHVAASNCRPARAPRDVPLLLAFACALSAERSTTPPLQPRPEQVGAVDGPALAGQCARTFKNLADRLCLGLESMRVPGLPPQQNNRRWPSGWTAWRNNSSARL